MHHIGIPDFILKDMIDVLQFYADSLEQDDGHKAKQILQTH